MDRKLAAILAADVVGYSTMMERDERGTYERLSEGRKVLFEPEIARHHGRIFKAMGDGLLAEFGSVVDAVECAVSLQRGLAERNAHVPEGQGIQVRIGINLGEVIVEGDDRFGEGVNIAARLEQLADPGGICVSGKVAKEVEKKLAFGFEPMGEQKVKNLIEPVQAFRVRLDGAANASRRPRRMSLLQVAAMVLAVVLAMGVAGGAFYWFGGFQSGRIGEVGPSMADGKPSLVVLPFANLSDDKEQGYLADGITEDLTTELARVPGLFVISRTAAFTYKGKSVAPAQIAKELGIRYILEGSTRRVADDMRINAQLIDAQTGGHLWAERFEGKWAQVFALQDNVISDVADALRLRLVNNANQADIAGGTSNPTAYEAYLQGRDFERRDTPADIVKAAGLYEQALKLDPDFGRASAALGWVYWNATTEVLDAMHFQGNPLDKLYDYLDDAARHPSPAYYQLLSEQLVWRQKSDEAIAALEKAIALDASDPASYEEMSGALTYNGRPADGRGYVDGAIRVEPNWTPWRHYLVAFAEFSMGHFEDVQKSLDKIDFDTAGHWVKYYGLILRLSAGGHLARDADIAIAKEKLKAVLKEDERPEFTGLMAQNDFPYKNMDDMERLLEGLRKAGVPQMPYGLDAKSPDRLDQAQIEALFYGHEIRGREVGYGGGAYWRKTEMDGSYNATVGDKTFVGISLFEGDIMCIYTTRRPRACRAIYRNPTGTPENENEYLYFRDIDRFEFSVVK